MDEEIDARLEALEKCVFTLGMSVIEHLPHVGETWAGNLESFEHHARQENRHHSEIETYRRAAEWVREALENSKSKSPKADRS